MRLPLVTGLLLVDRLLLALPSASWRSQVELWDCSRLPGDGA